MKITIRKSTPFFQYKESNKLLIYLSVIVITNINVFVLICSHPTSGSFVRPKKVGFGVSVTRALRQRYSEGEQEEDMFVLGKGQQKTVVEMVGAESVQQKQRYSACYVVITRYTGNYCIQSCS